MLWYESRTQCPECGRLERREGRTTQGRMISWARPACECFAGKGYQSFDLLFARIFRVPA